MRQMRNASWLGARISAFGFMLLIPAVAQAATCDSLKSLSLD